MNAFRVILNKITDTYYEVKWFFKNIYTFRSTLKYSRPWDYSGILYAIEDHLSMQISGGMGSHVGGDKHIQQMKVARELTRRIGEDDYYFDRFEWHDLKFGEVCPKTGCREVFWKEPSKKFDLPTWGLSTKTELRKQDLEMLTKILNKHILSWWD